MKERSEPRSRWLAELAGRSSIPGRTAFYMNIADSVEIVAVDARQPDSIRASIRHRLG